MMNIYKWQTWSDVYITPTTAIGIIGIGVAIVSCCCRCWCCGCCCCWCCCWWFCIVIHIVIIVVIIVVDGVGVIYKRTRLLTRNDRRWSSSGRCRCERRWGRRWHRCGGLHNVRAGHKRCATGGGPFGGVIRFLAIERRSRTIVVGRTSSILITIDRRHTHTHLLRWLFTFLWHGTQEIFWPCRANVNCLPTSDTLHTEHTKCSMWYLWFNACGALFTVSSTCPPSLILYMFTSKWLPIITFPQLAQIPSPSSLPSALSWKLVSIYQKIIWCLESEVDYIWFRW